MKKKTITFSNKNIQDLEKESLRLDISTSEIIRRLVDDYFSKLEINKNE